MSECGYDVSKYTLQLSLELDAHRDLVLFLLTWFMPSQVLNVPLSEEPGKDRLHRKRRQWLCPCDNLIMDDNQTPRCTNIKMWGHDGLHDMRPSRNLKVPCIRCRGLDIWPWPLKIIVLRESNTLTCTWLPVYYTLVQCEYRRYVDLRTSIVFRQLLVTRATVLHVNFGFSSFFHSSVTDSHGTDAVQNVLYGGPV